MLRLACPARPEAAASMNVGRYVRGENGALPQTKEAQGLVGPLGPSAAAGRLVRRASSWGRRPRTSERRGLGRRGLAMLHLFGGAAQDEERVHMDSDDGLAHRHRPVECKDGLYFVGLDYN